MPNRSDDDSLEALKGAVTELQHALKREFKMNTYCVTALLAVGKALANGDEQEARRILEAVEKGESWTK